MGFFWKTNTDYIAEILEKVTTNIEKLSKENTNQMELIEEQQQQINILRWTVRNIVINESNMENEIALLKAKLEQKKDNN